MSEPQAAPKKPSFWQTLRTGWGPYKRLYSYEFGPENVIVSNGAKHSLHNALAAVVGPGEEVVIPSPYWVSYSDLVAMTGATPVLVAH